MPAPLLPHSKRRPGSALRNCLAIASRITAAVCGGYYVAYACTALLTVVLPMDRINRLMTASLLSFVVWCAAAIWVFAARNTWRGWWPLLASGTVMLGAALAFHDSGMRP